MPEFVALEMTVGRGFTCFTFDKIKYLRYYTSWSMAN